MFERAVAVLNREGEVCLYFANNMHKFALSLWVLYGKVLFSFHGFYNLNEACVVFTVFHATDV